MTVPAGGGVLKPAELASCASESARRYSFLKFEAVVCKGGLLSGCGVDCSSTSTEGGALRAAAGPLLPPFLGALRPLEAMIGSSSSSLSSASAALARRSSASNSARSLTTISGIRGVSLSVSLRICNAFRRMGSSGAELYFRQLFQIRPRSSTNSFLLL